MNLNGIAVGQRSSQSVVEREVVLAHHLHCSTALIVFLSIEPHRFRIQGIVILFVKQDRQTERGGADGNTTAGGEVSRNPVGTGSLGTIQVVTALSGHKNGLRVNARNSARTSLSVFVV